MFMTNRDQFETQEQFEAYLMWKAEQKAMGVTFTEYLNEDTVTSHYEYEEGLQEEAASSHSLGMPIACVTHMPEYPEEIAEWILPCLIKPVAICSTRS
jgi:hypothetical protein